MPHRTNRPTTDQIIVIATAWVSTLLLSKLPLVIARDLLATDLPWITPAWIGIAIVLFATATVWPAIRPLRRYFLVMGAIILMAFWLDPFIRHTVVWQARFSGESPMVTLLGERVLLVLESLVVVSVLLLIGIKRKQAFLTVGNLNAPVGGPASSINRPRLTWTIFGTGMAVLLGGLFSSFMASQSAGGTFITSDAARRLPLILVCAALNAFGEETTYRAAPLATLLPAVGPTHAIWLTSVWFGLGHYYGGIPSGPLGLVQAGLLALLLAKAMLDTRGMGWSWIIHVVLDSVIYFFIAGTT